MSSLIQRIMSLLEALAPTSSRSEWRITRCAAPARIRSAEGRAFYDQVRGVIEHGAAPFTWSEEFIAPAKLVAPEREVFVDLLVQPFLAGPHLVAMVAHRPDQLEREDLTELRQATAAYRDLLEGDCEDGPVIPVCIVPVGSRWEHFDIVPLYFDARTQRFDTDAWSEAMERFSRLKGRTTWSSTHPSEPAKESSRHPPEPTDPCGSRTR